MAYFLKLAVLFQFWAGKIWFILNLIRVLGNDVGSERFSIIVYDICQTISFHYLKNDLVLRNFMLKININALEFTSIGNTHLRVMFTKGPGPGPVYHRSFARLIGNILMIREYPKTRSNEPVISARMPCASACNTDQCMWARMAMWLFPNINLLCGRSLHVGYANVLDSGNDAIYKTNWSTRIY